MLSRTLRPGRRASMHGRGFTLVELLTVIAILTTLSAMAAPVMVGMVVRHRVDGLRSELIQSMQQARSEAMARGNTVTLARLTGCSTALLNTTDWSCGWTAFVDMDADGQEEAGDVRLQTVSVPIGVRLTKPTAPNTSQQFNQFGQSVTLGQRFELSPVDSQHASLAGSVCYSTGTRLRYKQGTGSC
ncbi:GspH/FimT family pseudopilin [uncultured Hydrogenophaga sp.]|uniref:GspH/FimT family pseudopilin n=1 Tax=uncultured Hydrogenophaga sp. TaxID=199683 RepID=UPI00265ECFB3|nr:GspH/FimT family pseudopilin [uncultured Hydrogenophaga sp.]